MSRKLYPIAKVLQAGGIAAVMLGLVQGIYGDMWGELYLFLGGIVIFLVGRQMEKRVVKGVSTPEKAV